jgi:hypothetical protein
MPHNEKLNTLWKRIDMMHKRIIELNDELAEAEKYHMRIETQYREDIALLYKQSFDVYNEILLLTNNRMTPSAYDPKTDITSGVHDAWDVFKNSRTNTFDKKIQDQKYTSHRPDTSIWYKEDPTNLYDDGK